MFDHDGLLPCYGVITDGKQHGVTVTRQWEFAPGTILVFDRGYTDYNWFERLTQRHGTCKAICKIGGKGITSGAVNVLDLVSGQPEGAGGRWQ